MKSKKYYPFKRNHYFHGKLLTVRDFEAEQKYFNDKRRLLNRIVNGPGIAAGLDVVLVDDHTISLEMGMALDYMGREIIVEEPTTKKLSMLEGFDQLSDMQNVFLCIEYDEELQDPIHSVAGGSPEAENSSDFNRVKEAYKLVLTDKKPPREELSLNYLIEDRKVLYEDEYIFVEQVVPKYVSSNSSTEITVNVEKKNTTEPLELDYKIDSNYLKDDEGNKHLRVYYKEKGNNDNLEVQLTYPMYADNVKETTEALRVSGSDFSLRLGERELKPGNDYNFEIQVVEGAVREHILEDYYDRHFDELVIAQESQSIYLAKMSLITSGTSYIIDSITRVPFKQYLLNNELLNLLMKLDSKVETVRPEEEYAEEESSIPASSSQSMTKPDYEFTTGVEELDFNFSSTKNKQFFSNEIAHGLGKGPVAIILAVEDQSDISQEYSEKALIFGNNEVFRNSSFATNISNVDVAAVSYPDKGTFRIGVYISDNVEALGLNIRWWAYKYSGDDSEKDSLMELESISIEIEPDTVTLAPKETAHFSAKIQGTKNKECRWYVTEKEGGKIDANGVYEAPTAEGVYEVVAESVKYPLKKSSAYVVVKAQ